MTNADPGSPEPGPEASVEDIHADIEATRHELVETVEAISHELDVEHQASQKIAETKDLIVGTAVDDTGAARPVVPIAALALSVTVLGFLLWKRRD